MTFSHLLQSITDRGLAYRGTMQVQVGEPYLDPAIVSIVLVGFSGEQDWEAFAKSRERSDGGTDPLDRWSTRVLRSIAEDVGATPLFPFAGPQWWPFQKWGLNAEALFPTPIGILIHPKWGLWHSWRGALAFRVFLDAPPPQVENNPCDSCEEKPCLRACPVQAFRTSGYEVARCLDYLDEPDATGCMTHGCSARRACPIGAQYQYQPERAAFHMTAFRDGLLRSS